MEKEGLIRCVSSLKEDGVAIKNIFTDRHPQIIKWIRENLSDAKHTFDVWHVAKGWSLKLKVTVSNIIGKTNCVLLF